MKLNKLPSLVIGNPFSNSPIISKKINRLWVFLKVFFVVLIVFAISVSAFYVNVQHEQSIINQERIQQEFRKAEKSESSVVIDATAAIIVRDGNVSESVAKKYAKWIFEAAARHTVDPILVLSVMSIESKFNYRAISPTGPIGLLQVAYSWHKEKTTQAGLFDPKNNIDVGTQIIKEYAEKSSTEVETLLRYNGSLGKAPVYAVKVLSNKKKYETEIFNAIIKSV